MSDKEQIVRVDGLPIGAGFNWSVGVPMEKFMDALKDKKILGSKCSCGYVTAPPRTRCPRCAEKVGESGLVELSGKGKLVGRTGASAKLDGKCNFVDLKEPIVIGAVKLDGADSILFMPIEADDPDKFDIGASVSAVWSDELKGEISDLRCFKVD